MKREEKERKFHETLLKMLYPPPSSPPRQEEENKPINSWRESVSVDQIPDELDDEERSSSSSGQHDEGCNGATQKLTRAQRKRLRRKKLNEAACQRRKIIGPIPLLPNANDGGNGGVAGKAPESVRQNAAVETDNISEKSVGLSLDSTHKPQVSSGCMVGQASARKVAEFIIKMVQEGKIAGKAILLARQPGVRKTAIAMGMAKSLVERPLFVMLAGS